MKADELIRVKVGRYAAEVLMDGEESVKVLRRLKRHWVLAGTREDLLTLAGDADLLARTMPASREERPLHCMARAIRKAIF